MTGLVVDRTVPPARSRLSAPSTHKVVLLAVAFGLLFGALACAAGPAGGGVGHGAVEPTTLEPDGAPMEHADHVAPIAKSGSQSVPLGDHGGHSGSASTAESHPGMACVVSVDLHFPEATAVSISDSSAVPLLGLSAGCPADVDPPVPRFS